MIFTLCHAGKALEGGPELLQNWQDEADAWLWIDLQDEPEDTEKALLCETLGLDKFAVTEAQRPRHPPGFEAYPDNIYLLLKPLTSDTRDLDFNTLQLAIFAAPRLLVTRHNKPSRFIETQHQKLREQGCDLTPYSLTAAICHRVTERYGSILLDLENRLDEIEDLLFESQTDGLMEELVTYNTALRKVRRIIAYHTNAFASLRDYFNTDYTREWYAEFAEIHELMERFQSLAELYQNVLSDLVDAYISLNAHHLNQVMKILTIVTVIFVPLSLLVGIYGMNFENIPELKSPIGYYVLLTFMGLIAGGLLVLFRRMRWL